MLDRESGIWLGYNVDAGESLLSPVHVRGQTAHDFRWWPVVNNVCTGRECVPEHADICWRQWRYDLCPSSCGGGHRSSDSSRLPVRVVECTREGAETTQRRHGREPRKVLLPPVFEVLREMVRCLWVSDFLAEVVLATEQARSHNRVLDTQFQCPWQGSGYRKNSCIYVLQFTDSVCKLAVYILRFTDSVCKSHPMILKFWNHLISFENRQLDMDSKRWSEA